MITPRSSQFALHAEDQAVLDAADKFARKVLAPLSGRMDDEEWWPPEAFSQIGAAGFMGATVPSEYGGAGMDLFSSGLVCQAFARWNPALALSWAAHDNLCANNLFRNASEAQRRRYLPGLCDGSRIGALGLTEPGAGSDALAGMRTTARRDGDHYVLNGTKIYITNGPVADVLLVYAKTAPERGAKGISAFIVERGFSGFRVAQKLIKMGFRGSQTGELVFEDCRVPIANLVGPENDGVKIVMSGLDLERALVASLCVGIAERALDLSVAYAGTRQQFGKPIGSFQMVQALLAEMYTDTEAMKSLVWRTLADVNDLEIGGGGRGQAHKLTAASILFAGEACNRVLNKAVQVHGGSGYIWEAEINRLFRCIKILEIGAGTSEVRKLIIAEELLRS